MKRSFLLLVLSLFNSASGDLRQPLVDICRSRTNDDVSFRLCVTRCGRVSPTNQNSGPGADVTTVEGLFRQFGSDGDIETEGRSTSEDPECVLDPEGGRISPHGSGDAEEQDRARDLQREGDENDDESSSFVDFVKANEFGDLKKRLTALIRAGQQNLPDEPVGRHHVSAEEGELIHADKQERDVFPVSPSPKIAKNREVSSLEIIRGGEIEPVTAKVGSKENGNAPWIGVEYQTDENSELSNRLLDIADSDSGEGDANSLDLRPFGEAEGTENSFVGFGKSAFEESKRQLDREEMADSSPMRPDELSHEEKRPSFVRVGKSLSIDKRPSFVRVGKSLSIDKRPSFVRVGKSLSIDKRPSFVRVGKSLPIDKRPSFVRVGKSLSIDKRPSFVRVGKSLPIDKRPSFVRVGKSLSIDKRPSFVRVGKSLSIDKRPSFVRVGKSLSIDKRPSFVRVGKSLVEEKRPSFVRVGKSELSDIGDEDNVDLMSSFVGTERNIDRNPVKRQSFVRIGKSQPQAEPEPRINSIPSHSNNMRDSLRIGRSTTNSD